MRIGIAFDLRPHGVGESQQPDDIHEEYDPPETVAALAGALRALGHDTIDLGGGRGFLERMVARAAADAIDLVFNMAEGYGSRSREAHVPAVCEMLGVAYTHSDPLTLAVTLDKELTKRIAASHGIATAPACLIHRVDDVLDTPLPLSPSLPSPIERALRSESGGTRFAVTAISSSGMSTRCWRTTGSRCWSNPSFPGRR